MRKFVSRELIAKGWSDDIKYCARDEAGDKYLLRISKIEQYERKKNEYERKMNTGARAMQSRLSMPLKMKYWIWA